MRVSERFFNFPVDRKIAEGGSSRLDSAPVYGNAALRDEYSSKEDELAAQEELEQAIRVGLC